MAGFLGAIDVFLYVLRIALFVAVVVLAVVCLLDWLVRTRRINPFNPVARAMRNTVDPMMAPVERRILRAGGLPTSAPWWTLVFAIVGAIVLISVLGFVRGQIENIASSSQGGAMGLAALLIQWTFGILRLALIVRVISSWFRISPYSPYIRWSYQLTEWLLAPLRQIIPTIGVIDITPIVAYFLLGLLQGLFFSIL